MTEETKSAPNQESAPDREVESTGEAPIVTPQAGNMAEFDADAPAADPREGAKTPLFGGTTGGLLRAAEREEKYFIVWPGKAGQVFEMPTSGSAVMVEGTNMLTFARKEQCLALGANLRDLKIKKYQVFRQKPGEDPVLVHPKDGVFPEKSNEGREPVNKVDRNIGSNPEPATLKFTTKRPYDN